MKITIDVNGSIKPDGRVWQRCIGSDHAFQAHRTDWCEQLKTVHDELGIEYVRFHGILSDDMLTIQSFHDFAPMPGTEAIKTVNFFQVGHVLDNVIAVGMKPVIELSFMPSALASGNKTCLHYKGNITPPKDYDEYGAYIESFVRFLTERYGEEEVKVWYFEVWNEPDLPTFWAGTQEEYFRLYAYAARAIKSVNAEYRVGGPATSENKWIKEFCEYCDNNNVPYDFISTHMYPDEPFGNKFDMNAMQQRAMRVIKGAIDNGSGLSETLTEFFYKPEKLRNIPKGMLYDEAVKTQAYLKNKKPLFYTEYNSFATFAAPLHDEKYSAAFIVKTALDLGSQCDMLSYWVFSDIYEEIMFLPEPFVGGFGLITACGIKKPNFYAFKMLSQLGQYRYVLPEHTNEPVEYAAFCDGKKLQILLYAQSMEPKDEEHEVTISLNAAATRVTVAAIDDTNCNPKRLWQEMGSPKNLNRAQVQEINDRCALTERNISFKTTMGNGGCTTAFTVKLRTNDVCLITVR